MQRFTLIVSFIAVVSLLLNIKLLIERKNQETVSYKVLEVIDGDTFRVESGGELRRVRLMGVDAPEIGKCLSEDAKAKLEELLLNIKITLKDQFTDPYGRIMANVYVGPPAGGLYINKEILASGLGRMDYNENPKRNELKQAYGEARINKRGIHSEICVSENAPIIDGVLCDIKGNIDDNTQKQSYYLPECPNYFQVQIDLSTEDTWFCSEEDAANSGFIKNSNCRN